MGIRNYFTPTPPSPTAASTAASPAAASMAPSPVPGQTPSDGNSSIIRPTAFSHAQHLRTPSHQSKRASSISARSTRSYSSSIFVDDIKHEVVVNYLYQNQLGKNWVVDGSGETEGAIVRRSRNEYVACPEALLESPLAAAVKALNVPVSHRPRIRHRPMSGVLDC